MSLGYGVLAIDGWTDVAEVAAMVERCEAASIPALELMQELATNHGLTIWDPQNQTAC